MEFYKNIPLSLAYELSTETTTETIPEELGYPNYVVGRIYYQGDIVHSAEADGGDGRNYQLTMRALGFGGRPEDGWPWQEVGGPIPSGERTIVTETTVTDYLTNVDISQYPTWDGSGAYLGQIFFDSADGRNYAAAVQIDSADDTTRPSAAVNASDVDVASRWVLYSVANAFACLDNETATRTTGGFSIESTLIGRGLADRITFFGLHNCDKIDVTVSSAALNNDEYFLTDFKWWEATDDAEVEHRDPGTRVTSQDTTKDTWARMRFSGLTVGKEYAVRVIGTAQAVGGGSGYWSVEADPALPESDPQFGDQNYLFTFTANREFVRIVLRCKAGSTWAQFSRIVIRENSVPDTTYTVFPTYYGSDKYKKTVTIQHDERSFPQYEIDLRWSLEGSLQLALVTSGKGVYLGSTEADVNVTQHRVVSPERNDYGLVQFGLGVHYKQISARVWLPDDTGDEAASVLADVLHEPATWNLNCDDTNYERLIVQGWARKTKIKTTGLPGNDHIQLDLLSLSE